MKLLEKSKRVILRSWYYFRVGYSTYLSLPISLVGWSSAIYYLAIKNLPFLESLFPRFHYFVTFGIIVFPPLAICLGWCHFKKLFRSFFKAELDIHVESNPYATEVVTPIVLPRLKLLRQIAKQHGIDTSEVDLIIERSQRKFNV